MDEAPSTTCGDPAAITCDQAIFTSVRGPMGEGYRIIAASKGLKPEEKQVITRFSPSHDALCHRRNDPHPEGDRGAARPEPAIAAAALPGTFAATHARLHRHADAPAARPTAPPGAPGGDADELTPPPAPAVAFYALPTGRLCVACSCYAGAENTGRGGQRVYTLNVVFSAEDFARIAYNPFNVVRALEDMELTRPQLKPDAVLPALQLPAGGTPRLPAEAVTIRGVQGPIFCGLLDEQSVVVNVSEGWIESAEAVLLSFPGPMRAALAFSAGLRFSTGRTHRLQVLADENHSARARSAGQATQYVDAASPDGDVAGSPAPGGDRRAWLRLVARHWTTGDFSTLARRTSRPFPDVSAPALERIGRLYNHLDDLPQTASADLLTVAAAHIEPAGRPVEDEIQVELLSSAQQVLSARFQTAPWPELAARWPALVELWRSSPAAAAFAQPLINKALHRGSALAPLDAAELALDAAADLPLGADRAAHEATLDQVVRAFSNWCAAQVPALCSATDPGRVEQVARTRRLANGWKVLRPADRAVQSILDQIAQLSIDPPAA